MPRWTQASCVSGSASSSLRRRRHRPSQANVRSHHPPPRQHREALLVLRPGDDFDQPAADRPRPVHEVRLVALVGPDQAQSREPLPRLPEHQFGTITFLDVRRMHHHDQQQPQRIDQDVALAAGYQLGGIEAARPPFPVVLTDWLSMIAALGVAWRPAACRTCSRNKSCACSHTPARRQVLK